MQEILIDKTKQKQKTKIADTTGENIRNLFRLKKK